MCCLGSRCLGRRRRRTKSTLRHLNKIVPGSPPRDVAILQQVAVDPFTFITRANQVIIWSVCDVPFSHRVQASVLRAHQRPAETATRNPPSASITFNPQPVISSLFLRRQNGNNCPRQHRKLVRPVDLLKLPCAENQPRTIKIILIKEKCKKLDSD